MKAKTTIVLFALFTLLSMAIYFLINPSYEKSIKAKYYFEVGNYKEAYTLAQESFSLDVYNRMASTIMAQSKTALKYFNYNEMARKYTQDIDEIALHEDISNADRAKIRMICEIMLSSYTKLAPSVITDIKLVNESSVYNKKFEKLLEKVNRQK